MTSNERNTKEISYTLDIVTLLVILFRDGFQYSLVLSRTRPDVLAHGETLQDDFSSVPTATAHVTACSVFATCANSHQTSLPEFFPYLLLSLLLRTESHSSALDNLHSLQIHIHRHLHLHLPPHFNFNNLSLLVPPR